jgi:Do/DeqQ family serine protease
MIPLLLAFLLLVPAPASAQTDPRGVLRALEDAFASVAGHVMPAVVNISTTPKKIPPAAGGGSESEPEPQERFREFFGPEFYERFFKRPPREESRASGSGLIVDPAGYILTNNHVIENAQEITVRLSDARKFQARLVGRDPKTDLAVLKVDSPTPLPVADLGDSDHLRVGQWAIAIGNPFGLDRTVTVGIISATARTRVGVTTYESFIQTDASINPGNSGGPLLNIDGKVIGINTAIVATGQGIGFSIPINMAKEVMQQLITRGRVVRGWLGIVIQDLTDELASSFGVGELEGVLVSDVMKGGPAESSGLKPGDIIVELGGVKITEVPELQRRVAAVTPGESITLKVIRERQPISVVVGLGEMPGEEAVVAAEGSEEGWGMVVEPVSPEVAERLGPELGRGVMVTDVSTDGPAARAGLHPGDLILEVNREPVADVAAFRRMLAGVKAGEQVRLYVHRTGGGGREYLVMEKPAS